MRPKQRSIRTTASSAGLRPLNRPPLSPARGGRCVSLRPPVLPARSTRAFDNLLAINGLENLNLQNSQLARGFADVLAISPQLEALILTGARGFEIDDLRALAKLPSLQTLQLQAQPSIGREDLEALSRACSRCEIISDFGTFRNGVREEPTMK